MRETKYVFVLCCVLIVVAMGLTGCSTDRSQTASNQNGVSAPVDDTPHLDNCLEPPGACDQEFIVTVNRPVLLLVGVNGSGVVDPTNYGKFEVTVKDLSNQPVQGVTVEIDVAGSSYFIPGSVSICAVGAGVTQDENNQYLLSACTNANGVATFRAAGGCDLSSYYMTCGNWTPDNYRHGLIYVCGIQQPAPEDGWFTVATADLNHSGGVNGADQSLLLADKNCSVGGAQPYQYRSDLDGANGINSADLSIMLSIQFGAGSYYSAGSQSGCD